MQGPWVTGSLLSGMISTVHSPKLKVPHFTLAGFLFVCFLFCFETEFFCVALSVLELTM